MIDESAIKKAAGNRFYKGSINLPAPNRLEAIKDPKKVLHDFLKEASGLKTRRLKSFNVNAAVHLVAENIPDFNLLRGLSSFDEFEKDLKKTVEEITNSRQ